MAFFMKADVNDVMPNGTPNIIILSNGVVNWEGLLKLSDKLKGDQQHIYEVA
jgi:hypothetical protein